MQDDLEHNGGRQASMFRQERIAPVATGLEASRNISRGETLVPRFHATMCSFASGKTFGFLLRDVSHLRQSVFIMEPRVPLD